MLEHHKTFRLNQSFGLEGFHFYFFHIFFPGHSCINDTAVAYSATNITSILNAQKKTILNYSVNVECAVAKKNDCISIGSIIKKRPIVLLYSIKKLTIVKNSRKCRIMWMAMRCNLSRRLTKNKHMKYHNMQCTQSIKIEKQNKKCENRAKCRTMEG